MNNQDHTAILNMYLGKLSLGSIEAIYQAKKNQWHASLNLGNRAQLDAYYAAHDTIAKAIDGLLSHDIEHINKLLNETVRG